MRIVFGIVIFIIMLIIGILVVGFVLSSVAGISLFGGSKGIGGGSGGGVIVSPDGGGSWEFRNKGDEKNDISRVNVLDMVVSGQNPEVIYLGTRSQGLYKSENGGENWSSIPGVRGTVYTVGLDPQNQDNIYLAVEEGEMGRVLKSEDGGKTFKEVYIVASPKVFVYGVAVDPNDPRMVYAGTSGGLLLQSEDYGNSWKILNQFKEVVGQILINPKDPNEIYVTTSKGGLYRTIDRGKNWQKLGITSKSKGGDEITTALVIDPQDSNVFYIGTQTGLFRISNRGNFLEEIKTIIPSQSLPISAVAVSPSDSGTIYIGAQNQIYKSKDMGVSWTVKQLPTSKRINIMKIHPQDSNKIFAGLGG